MARILSSGERLVEAPGAGGAMTIRRALPADLRDLIALEAACFKSDRLSRRSLQYILTKAHAVTLVAEAEGGALIGSAVVLLHGKSALARLYSLAVHPAARGAGLGAALLAAAEAIAVQAGCAFIRLEVRPDNRMAIQLYRRAGYREIGTKQHYYQDDSDALRMEKRLVGGPRAASRRVPYYPQSLAFTCGPAALIMAMAALDPSLRPSRRLELQLWREATLVFMTSGHGGCGPFGLAVAARRRGFRVEVQVSGAGALFLDSVRNEDKRAVMRLVQSGFREEARELGIPIGRRRYDLADLRAWLERGAIPVVLISSYRLYGEKIPHWVVVTDCDRHFVYLNDPYVDKKERKTATDSTNLPVSHAEFERISRYGKARLSAAVVVENDPLT